MLGLKDVDLRLRGQTFDLPAPDPEFTRQVNGILTGSMDAYGFAVLDLTDPAQPRYAEHRGDHRQNVGSVGKLVVVLALFQALADTYPGDVDARKRVLKDAVVTADGFSQYDSHTVRIFDPKTRTLIRRPVQIGDRATLYEWVDWMLSPSSNSAAGMVMREAMLVRQYGKAYPPSEAEIKRFFDETPKSELTALYDRTFSEPVTRNGLDRDHAAPGEFLHRDRQAESPGRRRQLRHRPRADALFAAHGAGTHRRRVVEPGDQAPPLRDRAQDPLCIVAGAGRFRRVLQVRLAVQMRARKRGSPAGPTRAT